jgi:hypothetical protein
MPDMFCKVYIQHQPFHDGWNLRRELQSRQIERMCKSIKFLFVAISMAMVHFAACALTFQVAEAPEWNQQFERTNGWIGADVAYSFPLAPYKTFWLFGDTFVGQVSNGKRINSRMIHSSIAIQPLGQKLEFFYPKDKQSHPQSFMKSPDGKTDFWLMDGATNEDGLHFLMQQIEWTGDGVWGFRSIGTWLASVKNPDASPARWKISTKKLPFETLPDGEVVSLGSATLQTGGFIYIYGYCNPTNSTAIKQLILARVPENDLKDISAWEFFSNGYWTKNFARTAPIFSGAPPEGSVSWQPFLKKFVFVYTDGIWGKIVMRTADAPQGPWSEPTMLYQCPEMKISPQVFCYAGKGHPELSATNELLISYASNSEKLSEVLSDTRIYRPRFVRVTFETR